MSKPFLPDLEAFKWKYDHGFDFARATAEILGKNREREQPEEQREESEGVEQETEDAQISR